MVRWRREVGAPAAVGSSSDLVMPEMTLFGNRPLSWFAAQTKTPALRPDVAETDHRLWYPWSRDSISEEIDLKNTAPNVEPTKGVIHRKK